MTPRDVLKEVLALSEDDRRWLVRETAATLPEVAEDYELTAEDKAELDRRLTDAQAHPEAGIPWEEVKRSVLEHLQHEAAPRLG